MSRKLLLPYFIVFTLWIVPVLVSAQVQRTIDSLKAEIKSAKTSDAFVRTSFAIADNFMEVDRYDSAQLWLNRIAEQLPLKQPSLFSYFLSTRQSEVYYYNGLQRLGLQESQRSLSIAQALGDGLLLADSYNFIGLFYINLDSAQKAIPFFQEGMKFCRQPPYPPQYLSLSKPHHLYGNIAEAYEKSGQYDSAINNSRHSLELAKQIAWARGIAIAYNNLGNVYLKIAHADSAVYYFNQSLQAAMNSDDFDVELIDYGGLATAYTLGGGEQASLENLQRGFALIEKHTFINELFLGQFLDRAIAILKKLKKSELLTEALQQKAQLLTVQMEKNNRQINIILNAGLQNERNLLRLQVNEAEQKKEIANTRTYLLLSLLVLLVAGFLLYRYRLRQRLQVAQLQNKISQDLHDDVGSSLSSLQVYSAVAEKLMDEKPAEAKAMLKKIAKASATAMENIGDIVWSIKTESDQRLAERIKNFVADVLGAAGINYTVFIEDGIEESIRNMQARKNILLIIKEAVNNTVKYSKATNASVSIKGLAGHICVQVSDDGIGFEKEAVDKKGWGLSHLRQRTEELGGIYELTTSPGKGTTISALFPLTKISDSY